MQYGIKLADGAWLQFLSEYNNSKRSLTFTTAEEAEVYAQNLELKNFIIEEYNDTKPTLPI